MRFLTDEQTLEDLNIFGRREDGSIYGIFNRTATRGGAQVLEEWFRYPLADAESINRRSETIRRHALAGAVFPFRSELFDTAELYLSNIDERTKLPLEERTLSTRLTNAVGADTEYKNIQKGVTALMEILQGAAKETILESELQLIVNEPPNRKLSYTKVSAYDLLLRFKHRESIRKILRQLYILDVYISVGKVAKDRGFTYPHALPSENLTVQLNGVYHPRLKTPIPNTLHVTPEENVLFLTGANMAGKSTFMKTVGIALFLAHMGLPVPAASMTFSVLDGMYTTINLPDNLGMGASHFYAEVLRVKKITQELNRGRRLLVIFDELFRGTNVKDAYEATIAITQLFAQKTQSLFVISTHIIEAGEVLKERCPNVRFVRLPTQMNGHTPVYTHILEEGITADRHGMVIIENEGILETLKAGPSETLKAGPSDTQPGSPLPPSPDPPHAFTADQQTIDDLNLTGKYKPHTIYSLFNHVQTRGGERLLDAMFRQPLSDDREINRRSAVFHYFGEKALNFPFTREEIGRVEDYLNAGSNGSFLSAAFSVVRKKLHETITRDEASEQLRTSIELTINVIQKLARLIQGLEGTLAQNLKDILGDKRLAGPRDKQLSTPGPAQKLSLIEIARYDHLFRHVLQEKMTQMLEGIYQLDLNIAVSNIAVAKGFTYAQALPRHSPEKHITRGENAPVLSLTSLRHPALDKGVPNSLTLDLDHNMLFLTGANMAGKSTLMKSVGIAVYLAHMGFPVAAEHMRFSIRDGLYTSINVPDNLQLGYSHFFAEVLRVKTVAEKVSAGNNMVVIFDELFKGTNVKDAYDATLVVSEAFAGYRSCAFIISTHIIEVGEVLRERCKNLKFAYLPTIMQGIRPKYTYSMKEGITSDRHGMLIIENEGILTPSTASHDPQTH